MTEALALELSRSCVADRDSETVPSIPSSLSTLASTETLIPSTDSSNSPNNPYADAAKIAEPILALTIERDRNRRDLPRLTLDVSRKEREDEEQKVFLNELLTQGYIEATEKAGKYRLVEGELLYHEAALRQHVIAISPKHLNHNHEHVSSS